MTAAALLNPQPDLSTSKAMLNFVEKRLRMEQTKLCTITLDREDYLEAISVAKALSEVHTELSNLYRSSANK